MSFSYQEEQLKAPALDLSYHLTPWDEPIFQGKTAAISSVCVRSEKDAAKEFESFRRWCRENRILLVSCQLQQDQLLECGFLEAQGFRFIELNYRPTVSGLGDFSRDPDIAVHVAELSDAPEISGIAGQIFEVGRLHLDPRVGPEIGNSRYAAWAANAFRHPGQTVLKCVMDGRTIAFAVVETPAPCSRFWSLIGLAPGLARRGLGRRVWQTLLAFHHLEGVREVSTSISSHNIPVQNLYVALGFRFPPPLITLHWLPLGSLRRPR